MEGRFAVRREELLAQARVSAEDWSETTARLETFVAPFVGVLEEAAQRRHFVEYSSGLLSNLERKTGEGIAYLHGQDRKPMQSAAGGWASRRGSTRRCWWSWRGRSVNGSARRTA